MMLDAHNSLRRRRREIIFCDLPSNIMNNKGYFHGYGKKFLIRIITSLFSHLYILSVSKTVKSLLMYNMLWVGYLSFKLKSTYQRQGWKCTREAVCTCISSLVNESLHLILFIMHRTYVDV